MSNPFPLEKNKLLEAYSRMKTIREFEERLHVDFGRGDIPGFVHLYAGEEASGVGIMMHLEDHDRIASTHRGHGHCIAKGVDVKKMMAEIYRLLLADDVATSDSDYLVFETKTHANSYFVRPEMYRLLSDVLLQTLRLSAARVWGPAVEASVSRRLNAMTTAINSALINN